MLNIKTPAFLLLIIMGSSSLRAQDSLSLFKVIVNQYDTERNFKAILYNNPASMANYSNYSFSEFGIGYHDENKKVYRQQLGNGDKGLTAEAGSFQKLKTNRYVWGTAGYQNLKTDQVRWNETLDYERISPYIAADSVGGHLKTERYHFSGGYLQKINRWSVAGEMSYLAQMGYRTRDPRLKSTTSDLRIRAGINYNVFKKYEVGIFGEFSKYTQNSSITFQSALGRAYTYQMTGLGASNYLFNGGTYPNSTYEEFAYKGGLQILGNGGKDFYISVAAGTSNNIKAYINSSSSNLFNDLSELKNETFELEGAKFFNLKEKHRIGISANFSSSVKTGSEYGYSLNTASLTQIFKRTAYRKENYTASVKGFYQYTGDHFSFSATPFYGYEEIKERRLYPNAGQKFTYSYIGLNIDYKQQIKENQILTLQPYFSKRIANKSVNALVATGNNAVDAWILQDYTFQASDMILLGTSLRYDFALKKLPSFFVSTQYQLQNIQKNNNHFIGASIGITF